MILCSFNIRGLGGAVKKSIIRNLIRKERVEFLAIQETKLEIVTDSICYAIWGDNNCNWAYLPASGSSGGILSLWNKSIFSLIFSKVVRTGPVIEPASLPVQGSMVEPGLDRGRTVFN
jgi:hypothetical protein